MKQSSSYAKTISLILIIAVLLSSVPLLASADAKRDNVAVETADITAVVSAEMTAKRREFEKHFLLSDGSFIAVCYAEAIHYKNADGKWEEVDNRLFADRDGRIRNNYDGFVVSFADSANDNRLVSMTKDAYTISWSLLVKGEFSETDKQGSSCASKAEYTNRSEEKTVIGKNAAEAEKIIISKSYGKLSYSKLFEEAPEISAEYTVFHNKIEEDIIINAPTKVREFVVTVQNGGFDAVLCDDGIVEFRNPEGKAEFVFGVPYMCDARDEVLNDIRVTVDNNGKTTIITYIPDANWIASEERMYPILFDPSITTAEYNSNIVDTYVAESDTSNHSSEQKLYYGVKNGKIHRTYIKINNLPNIDATMPIIGATMKMTFTANTSTGKTAQVYKASGSWNPSTITYANQPGYSASGYLDSHSFTAGSLAFDLTDDFENLYAEYNAAMNYGYVIKYADESNVDPDYNAFRSMEYTTNPEQCPLFTISYGYSLPNGLTNSGVYSFRNYGSWSYMTVYNGTDANGTNVIQESVSNISNLAAKHKFELEYVSSSGGYRLKAMCSANQYRTLDIVKTDGYVEDGGNVQIYKPTDDLAQHWFIIGVGINTFKLIPRTNMSLALTVYPSSANGTSSGTLPTSAGNVFVSEYDDENAYQKWQIIDSSGNLVPCTAQNLPNATYYLNNMYYGKYLHKNSSNINAASGLISNLANTIRWTVTHRGNNQYTIQSANDTSKYLCVTSGSLSLSALPNNGLNNNYLWRFEQPYQSGGRYISNVATGKYLYETSNTNIGLSTSNGSNGSNLRKQCTWRVANINYFTSDKELNDGFSINELVIEIGDIRTPVINKSPSSAIWATPSDFSYSFDSSNISIDSNTAVITASVSGNVTVTATHKPTGRQTYFYVCVCQYTTTVNHYYDNGFLKRNSITSSTAATNIKKVYTFTNCVYAFNLGIKINIPTPILFSSIADNCTGYSTITALNQDCSCPGTMIGSSNNTDTTHKNNRNMLDIFQSAHPATGNNKYVFWTGHTTREWQGSTRKTIDNGAFTRSNTYVMALNNPFTDPLVDKAIHYILTHESGHLFGLPDSYCSGKHSDESCGNPNCAWHGGAGIFGQNCIMSNRSYAESTIESILLSNSKNYADLLCDHCRDLATNWVTTH